MMDKRQFQVIVLCLLLIAALVFYATWSANDRAAKARQSTRMNKLLFDYP